MIDRALSGGQYGKTTRRGWFEAASRPSNRGTPAYPAVAFPRRICMMVSMIFPCDETVALLCDGRCITARPWSSR